MGGISEDQVNLILDSTNNYMGKSWRNAFGAELATARYEMSKQRLARDKHEDAVEQQEIDNFSDKFIESLNIKENGAPPETLVNQAIAAIGKNLMEESRRGCLISGMKVHRKLVS